MTISRLLLFCLLVAAAVTASVVGQHNGDEGWYLHAGRRVVAGDIPYKDFAFTQAPLSAYVYGAILHVVPGHRIRTGRIVSLLFLLLASAVAAHCAAGLAGREAGGFALLLLITNPDWLYYGTLAKPFALAALLLVSAVALAYDRRPSRSMWAPGLAALSSTVRLSLAAVPALLCGWEVLRGGRRRFLPIVFLLVGSLPLLIVLFAPRAFWHQAVEFHRFWGSTRGLAGQILEMLHMHATLLLACGLGIRVLLKRDRKAGVLMLAVIAFALCPQFIPVAHHPEYIEPIVPLLAVAGGIGLGALGHPRVPPRYARYLIVAVLIVFAIYRAPRCFGFANLDRRLYPLNPLRAVEEAAAAVDSVLAPGDTLLTWTTLVAVEGRRPLPAGHDMGHFSLVLSIWDGKNPLKEWPTPEEFGENMARRYPVLFWEQGVVGVTDVEGFWKRAWSAYRPVRKFPGFGQWGQTAVLYAREDRAHTTPMGAAP